MKRRNQIHNKIQHPGIMRQGVTGHLRKSLSKILAATLMLSIFAFISCNEEEFLDKRPHTATDNSFYTTESGAEQGINAAYDILQLGESIERCLFAGTVCSGDAMAGGEPGGNDQRHFTINEIHNTQQVHIL
jgi:hypothetical protein